MRSLNSYNKIVIKIGSAVLAGSNGLINHSILASISEDIAWLLKNGKEVLIVSSGAIALGCKKMNINKKTIKLDKSQAIASIGPDSYTHLTLPTKA